MDVDESLPRPDAAMVADVVGGLTGRTIDARAHAVERLNGGYGASQGVFRVHGGDGEDAWSAVLKVLGRTPTSAAPDRWDRWDREAEAYRHGVADRLPAGLAAPRCAGVVDVDADTRWIWLEDLRDGPPLEWSLDDHADIARALGAFNGDGLVAAGALSPEWFSRQWLRGWVEENAEAAAGLGAVVDLPLVARTWPGPMAAALATVWDERERYLTILERLPQALCHLDVFHGNLAGRRGDHGATERVLIDWAFVGLGALGEELVPLIHTNLLFRLLTPDQVADAERRCLSAYVEGVRRVGWEGDERVPRLGYAAAGALRYSIGALRQWLPVATGQIPADVAEAWLGRPLTEAADNVGNVARVALRLAREAVELADELALG